MSRPVVAFYAPMKAPDHPVPSGDREIARLTLRALELAGFAPFVTSDLRIFDGKGNAAIQADLNDRAAQKVADLIAELPPRAPALWFTYHCHYKAPDLVGPSVAKALGIPYAISEPSISAKRRDGPWAGFARASDAAIAQADCLFWSTARDAPALEAAGHKDRMVHLKPFIDPGPTVPARDAHEPLRLLTVAMMRPGDKLESFRRLAAGLHALDAGARPTEPGALGLAPEITDWSLDIHGDGPARPDVQALFGDWPDRVRFHGAGDGDTIRGAYERADILVWPGVGEGVGMVYLEAQATALPVVSEDHPAQRDIVFTPLAAADDSAAFAEAIRFHANQRKALGQTIQNKIQSHHSLTAAADTLRTQLLALL